MLIKKSDVTRLRNSLSREEFATYEAYNILVSSDEQTFVRAKLEAFINQSDQRFMLAALKLIDQKRRETDFINNEEYSKYINWTTIRKWLNLK